MIIPCRFFLLTTMDFLLLASILGILTRTTHTMAIHSVLESTQHENADISNDAIPAEHSNYEEIDDNDSAVNDWASSYHNEYHIEGHDVNDGYDLYKHAKEHHGEKNGLFQSHMLDTSHSVNAVHEGVASGRRTETGYPVLGVDRTGSGYGVLGNGFYFNNLGYRHALIYGLGLGSYGPHRFRMNSPGHHTDYGLNRIGFNVDDIYRAGFGDYGNGYFLGHF